ncbi:hypothetical protein TIFTF001_013708 [Ficus carica]|uniref:Uncharacterized protein n=1 Tax=Ficus carica TaxID=3494 RepID=A0AA88A2G0_FICCA|nr:hypothetical protein TIFTF001_013708 [Ficus carica]
MRKKLRGQGGTQALFSQRRHFCKTRRRYWTHGDSLSGTAPLAEATTRTPSDPTLPSTLPLSPTTTTTRLFPRLWCFCPSQPPSMALVGPSTVTGSSLLSASPLLQNLQPLLDPRRNSPAGTSPSAEAATRTPSAPGFHVVNFSGEHSGTGG